MTNLITGGCLCGGVRYQIATGPGTGLDAAALPGTYCHCSMCRKATGGGYALFVSVPNGDLSWIRGAPSIFRSSPLATRGFCQGCGSPLYYAADGADHLAITAGSLDDPGAVKPYRHYGIEGRLKWADCGPGLPGEETTERFEGQP